MHHFITGISPEVIIDHKDGDGLNNRKQNMRRADSTKNAWNRWRKLNKRHSQYKGVHANARGLWFAVIQASGVRHYLGSFHSEIEAAKAYDSGALRLHGEFARVNFPDGGSVADGVCA